MPDRKFNGSGVKFVAQCLRDLNRYSTGCNANQYVRKSRMREPPAQHGLQASQKIKKIKSSQALKRSSGLTFNMGYYKILNYEKNNIQ